MVVFLLPLIKFLSQKQVGMASLYRYPRRLYLRTKQTTKNKNKRTNENTKEMIVIFTLRSITSVFVIFTLGKERAFPKNNTPFYGNHIDKILAGRVPDSSLSFMLFTGCSLQAA